jgi:acyl-coenzyme A thioesterase PaaI-like protein
MLPRPPLSVVLLAAGLLLLAVAARYVAKKFRFLFPSKKVLVKNILRAMGNIDHGFDTFIGLNKVQVLSYDNGELTLQYRIPVNMSLASCLAASGKGKGKDKGTRTDKDEDSILEGCDAGAEIGVGAVLALADVFTTLLLLAADADHRPGVSVSLTGEVFKRISVGEVVTIKTRVLKLGANLGFTEMWVYSAANEPLARAKHIKYLNMGKIWDIYGFLLPLIVNLYNYKRPYLNKSLDVVLNDTKTKSQLATLFSESIFQKEASLYYVHENKSLQNLYGFMHGGALCCLLELCIIDSFLAAPTFPPMAGGEGGAAERGASKHHAHGLEPLRYLEVSFLSPCKGSLQVGIEHHSLGLGEEPEASDKLETFGAAGAGAGAAGAVRPRGCLAGKVYSVTDRRKSRVMAEAAYSY